MPPDDERGFLTGAGVGEIRCRCTTPDLISDIDRMLRDIADDGPDLIDSFWGPVNAEAEALDGDFVVKMQAAVAAVENRGRRHSRRHLRLVASDGELLED